MKVLVGQSYYLRFDDKLWRAMQPYPPLGSLYAASVLREAGHEVVVFDAMLAGSEWEWDRAVAAHRPDVAVIFEDNFNYLSKMCLLRMRAAAFEMLAMAAARGCTTIVCGSDATDHAVEYLAHGAEHVVVGEGEVTMRELLAVLAQHDSSVMVDASSTVVGIVRRDRGGTLVQTGRRENQRDLDAIPFPARDLIDIKPYRQAWARHGRFSLNMVTTRGCPFHCNWCAKPIWGQRYAVRSPENVADELALVRASYAPDHISFVDDIFGLRPGWVPAYADVVRSRGIVTPFKCLSRADLLVREGEVEALRDAGCEMVWMGAESGAQSILDAMDKGTRVEQIVEATRRLHAVGIRVGFFLQFGYPGEGAREIEATRRLVRTCRPDDIGISVSYPLPGTRFHERVRDQMAGLQNWVDSNDLSMLYEGPFSTEAYRQLHTVVHREFRLAQRRPTDVGGVARRVRDAVTLPFDERTLRGLLRTEQRSDPHYELQHGPTGPDLEAIADAFSRTAEHYDSFAVGHPHLTRMRNRVYAMVGAHVPAGARVLELNAGSGTDAVALATRGYRVHATDVAAGMLDRVGPKAAAAGVGDRVSTELCSFLDLDQVAGAPYDAVFSDLGGLNCVADLGPVARGIDGVLRPGGVAVLVVMPPICLWELALVALGKFRLATRRLRRGGTRARLEGREFRVHYFTPRAVRAAFGPGYRLVALEGLAVFTPTAESKNLATRHRRAYSALAWLDDRLAPHRPFSACGDFFMIVLCREGAAPP